MNRQAERLIELTRLANMSQKTGNEQKLCAFTSGKGGTGKTFICVNLAYDLAQRGKKVLLVDLDTNFSNINILLNANGRTTLLDFLTHRQSIENTVTRFSQNLHVIFGDSGRLDYPTPAQRDMDQLMREIRKLSAGYDYVFLDLASGANEEILNVLSKADINFIVTNPEPTAIMDSYVMVKLLKNRNSNSKRLIIINKAPTYEDGQQAFENLNNASKHFLQEELEFFGQLDNDPAVPKSIMAQEILVANYPNSIISSQISDFSKKIAKSLQLANSSHASLF